MRRRITLLVVGMTVLVVLAFAIPLAVLIRSNAYSTALTDLQRDGSYLATYLNSSRSTRTSAQIRSELARFDDESVSVELPNGQILGTAPPGSASDLPAPTYGRPPYRDGSGGGSFGQPFGDRPQGGPGDSSPARYADGRLLQVPARSHSGGFYVVRVYASDGQLYSGETGPWLLLALASVVLLIIGAVLGEVLTRRIVRPLLHTAETAQRLAAGDITARATTSGPGEIAEVGRSLNRLADRVDQLIAEERETVADLSHRLRTPLTALRLDAETLRDEDDARRIGEHVGTLERMLTAVIRAARRPQREGRMPSADATAVVGDRVRFWSALAEDQGRTQAIALPDRPLPVRAAAEDLAAAVDALLENVIAHTPEGTAFSVRLTATADGARLDVADDGPGLPGTEHVRGRSDRGSSGLGLSIAHRTATGSGGSMTLGSAPSGGALITLVFGVA